MTCIDFDGYVMFDYYFLFSCSLTEIGRFTYLSLFFFCPWTAPYIKCIAFSTESYLLLSLFSFFSIHFFPFSSVYLYLSSVFWVISDENRFPIVCFLVVRTTHKCRHWKRFVDDVTLWGIIKVCLNISDASRYMPQVSSITAENTHIKR